MFFSIYLYAFHFPTDAFILITKKKARQYNVLYEEVKHIYAVGSQNDVIRHVPSYVFLCSQQKIDYKISSISITDFILLLNKFDNKSLRTFSRCNWIDANPISIIDKSQFLSQKFPSDTCRMLESDYKTDKKKTW